MAFKVPLLAPWFCLLSSWAPARLKSSSVQFSSVAQSCPTLCDPMNHRTPSSCFPPKTIPPVLPLVLPQDTQGYMMTCLKSHDQEVKLIQNQIGLSPKHMPERTPLGAQRCPDFCEWSKCYKSRGCDAPSLHLVKHLCLQTQFKPHCTFSGFVSCDAHLIMIKGVTE